MEEQPIKIKKRRVIKKRQHNIRKRLQNEDTKEEHVEIKMNNPDTEEIEMNKYDTEINKHDTEINKHDTKINKHDTEEIEINKQINNKKNIKQPVAKKTPAKRGRKPKGGQIILQPVSVPPAPTKYEPKNIIMHLKCSSSDLKNNIFEYKENDIASYSFNQNNNVNNLEWNTYNNNNNCDYISLEECENVDNNINITYKKLRNLEKKLHKNDISGKSDCFWCTCGFDNPPIYIPTSKTPDGGYKVYGNFCRPECAAAFLFKSEEDSSSKSEYYSLLNFVYGKIFNYTKNIKPAPDPRYLLNKYLGNLTIQEYRKLFNSDRLLFIVDKPLSRQFPELHEDNDEFIINNTSIPSASKYKFKKKEPSKPKNEIIKETFAIC